MPKPPVSVCITTYDPNPADARSFQEKVLGRLALAFIPARIQETSRGDIIRVIVDSQIVRLLMASSATKTYQISTPKVTLDNLTEVQKQDIAFARLRLEDMLRQFQFQIALEDPDHPDVIKQPGPDQVPLKEQEG